MGEDSVFVVVLDNQGEADMVTATVVGPGAGTWAKDDQTIDGSRWETEGPNWAYAILLDRPGLVASLEREGYILDDAAYCPPSAPQGAQ